MADVSTSPSAVVETTTPKKSPKKAGAKTKTARPKSSHPPTAVMVNAAIKNLKERGGSSLQAIKKYMTSTYKIDAEKLAPFIKKYIKASVASGALVQTKGKGASGSFKLAGPGAKAPSSPKEKSIVAKKPVAKKAAAKPKAKSPEKPVVSSPPKKPAAKKTAKPKKSPAKKVVVAPKPKSPVKAKTAPKSPVKKPKSPKAKTTKPKVAAKSKKASPKKK